MNPADSQVDFASWGIPGKSFTVRYPLEVFHEIDFLVNEGYRRIPHGGVETGGVLWGHADAQTATISTFRQIECEHAAGPSFILSETDLTRLKEQISAGAADSELADLHPIGFYVAHTRGALAMNERDAALLDRFFPQPGHIVLLIKPERFQPTRFSFVVRELSGRVDRSTAEHALILPLTGRALGTGGQAMESIAAGPKNEPIASQTPPEPPARLVSATILHPNPKDKITPPIPPARTVQPDPLPSVEEIRRRRESRSPSRRLPEPTLPARDATRPSPLRQSRSSIGFFLVLVIAALLGCGAGYWAYLQLPAATIPISIERRPSSLLISWPAEQTRNAAFAAIRVDDGQALALTSEQKSRGEAEVRTTDRDVKLELIAHHWLRDSRGIVRYVRGSGNETAQPSAMPQSPATQPGAPAAGVAVEH